MKTEIKTTLHVCEGLVGYNTVQYIPKNIILGRFNGLAIGAIVAVVGALMPDKAGGNHALALGLGVAVGGVLDAFGLKR